MTTRPSPAKPTREQLEAINSSVHYAMFSAFALVNPIGDDDREAITDEVEALFAELTEAGVRIRGVYDVAGLRADADVLIWWHADEIEMLQTPTSGCCAPSSVATSTRCGPTRPCTVKPSSTAATSRPSSPARSRATTSASTPSCGPTTGTSGRQGPSLHARRARRHGPRLPGRARQHHPGLHAGDYEWILAFEADELHRIVDLMRELRASKARLHVREEVPFFTGPRVSVEALVAGLR